MFGVYPVEYSRFSEAEAFETRISTAALHTARRIECGSDGSTCAEIYVTNGLKARLFCRSGLVRAVDFIDGDGDIRKRVDYEYGDSTAHSSLTHMKAELPERSMVVGFNGRGLRVSSAGEQRVYKDVREPFRSGGRVSDVTYERIKLGCAAVVLPVAVSVVDGRDGAQLRSAKLYDFEMWNPGAGQDAEPNRGRIATFSTFDRDYMRILGDYWHCASGEVLPAHLAKLLELRKAFLAQAAGAETVGVRLRLLHQVLDIDLVLDDSQDGAHILQNLLEAFRAAGLKEMAPQWSYWVLDRSVLWGRTAQSTLLCSIWADEASNDLDTDDALHLAAELAEVGPWASVCLLERVQEKHHSTPPVESFRLAGQQCKALRASMGLMDSYLTAHNQAAAAQGLWIRTCISTNALGERFTRARETAAQIYSTLSDPSTDDKRLCAELGPPPRQGHKPDRK